MKDVIIKHRYTETVPWKLFHHRVIFSVAAAQQYFFLWDSLCVSLLHITLTYQFSRPPVDILCAAGQSSDSRLNINTDISDGQIVCVMNTDTDRYKIVKRV
jgi:hypothetical protein